MSRPWHGGRVGGGISSTMYWFIYILFFFGGAYGTGVAFLAIFFRQTFNEIFGTR